LRRKVALLCYKVVLLRYKVAARRRNVMLPCEKVAALCEPVQVLRGEVAMRFDKANLLRNQFMSRRRKRMLWRRGFATHRIQSSARFLFVTLPYRTVPYRQRVQPGRRLRFETRSCNVARCNGIDAPYYIAGVSVGRVRPTLRLATHAARIATHAGRRKPYALSRKPQATSLATHATRLTTQDSRRSPPDAIKLIN